MNYRTPDIAGYRDGELAVASNSSGDAWARGLSASLILVVCIRFFSENLHIVPAVVKYVDVPLTAAVAVCAILGFLRRGHRVGSARLGTMLFVFLLVALISVVVNSSRTRILPAGMFIYNFLCPLIFALVTMHAPLGSDGVQKVVRTFFWLGIGQIAISVVYSLPRFFASGNPDYVSGTFGLNAYQFTYFLGVWFLYILGRTIVQSPTRGRWTEPATALAGVAVFGLFYAAQYRAMLVFFTLVVVVSLLTSPVRFSKRITQAVVVTAVSATMLISVATAFPDLKLLRVFDLFEDSSPLVQSGKMQAVRNVGSMYTDMPHTAIIGSGPATFISRSYEVFASEPKVEAAGSLALELQGGRYSTDVAAKYLSHINAKSIQGGTTVSNPQSSYTALAAEVGLLGLVVYLSAYVSALIYARRRLVESYNSNDQQGVALAFACFGGLLLLLVQALFDNWLEVTRVSIPLWTLVGLLYSHNMNKTPAVLTPGPQSLPKAPRQQWGNR